MANPQSIAMNAPKAVTAGFQAVTVTPPAPTVRGLRAAYSFDRRRIHGERCIGQSVAGERAVSGAAFTAEGRFCGARAFDGVNDWITVADAPGLDVTGSMTVSACGSNRLRSKAGPR